MGIKRQQIGTRRPVEVDFFDPVDVRNVGYESDDTLHSGMQNLFAVRDRWMKKSVDPTPVEVEICYLRNEMQQRSTRKLAHEQYMSKLFSSFNHQRTAEVVVSEATAHVN